jgi:hypothetical protein
MAKIRKTKSAHTIFVFAHLRIAERAILALLNSGVDIDRLSLFVHARADTRQAKAKLDAAIDAGGNLGAGLGAATGAALFFVPGIGPILSGGPLAAAVLGLIVGGTAGGFGGSLSGAGVSKVAAAQAEHHVRQGRAVLLVRNEHDHELISRVVHSEGAVEEAMA